MPLFTAYSSNENLGVGMAGVATAAYIFGLIPVALLLGGISDRFGKKRILLCSVALAIISVSAITIFPNLYAVIFARTVVGASIGIGIATGSAFLTVLFNQPDEKNAASLVALVTACGFGIGALATGVFISFQFTLRPPTFWIVLIALIIGLGIGMVLLPRDETPKFKTRIIRMPIFPTGVGRFNLSIAMFWSVTGIVVGVLPSQLNTFDSGNWSGFSLFLVNGTGALCLPLARRLSVNKALRLSYVLLPIGLALLSYGTLNGQLFWILLGCSILGSVNYGFGFYATLNGAGQLDPKRKARVVAGYLISAYVGFGGAALGIGFLADSFGLQRVLIIYLISTGLLSLILLLLRPKGKPDY